MATAGSDGKVRIWTLMPVLDHRSELDDKIPKKLATLTDHTDNDVNVVRFSPDGQYLATAGEDQSVLLYKRSAGKGRRTFGTMDDGPNIENWKIHRTFRRVAPRCTMLSECA
jgi:chromatin assembly factor 1 subunit B